jgi:hypothetical protein
MYTSRTRGSFIADEPSDSPSPVPYGEIFSVFDRLDPSQSLLTCRELTVPLYRPLWRRVLIRIHCHLMF